MKLDISDKRKYKTVGEMLEYIRVNDIPMDALVLTEQLKDFYLENKNDNENWDYYETQDHDFNLKLIPAHNGFGSAFHKKAFVIWMHY